MESVAEYILKKNPKAVIVIKSTVPVGFIVGVPDDNFGMQEKAGYMKRIKAKWKKENVTQEYEKVWEIIYAVVADSV